jgi:hypothetical protein
MYKTLLSYKGLQYLALELLSFDLNEVRSEFLEILKWHSDSLLHLKLSRNLIPGSFLEAICSSLEGGLVSLESIDLLHLKEANKINWPSILGALGTLAKHGRSRPIKVKLSDYQTQLKRQEIFEFIEKTQPNIELNFE